MVSDRYYNKYKLGALSGIVITQIEVITVTRIEQLYIFMKHEDFGDHELHCVQKWVRVIRESSEANSFNDSKKKEGGQSNPMPVRLVAVQLI